MNEIFNIRRFGAYAIKSYQENKKSNIIFLIVMLIILIIEIWDSHDEPILLIMSLIVLNIATIYTAITSFNSLTSSRKAISSILTPISNFERYLFAVLNSTLAVLIVVVLLFYGIYTINNAYHNIGTEKISDKTELLENNISSGQNILSLEKKSRTAKNYGKTDRHITMTIGGLKFPFVEQPGTPLVFHWLLTASIFLWGSITFRKRKFILTALLHFVIMVTVFTICVIASKYLVQNFGTIAPMVEVGQQQLIINTYNPLVYINYFPLLLFPVYFVVTWLKMKNKQLK